MDQMRLFFLFSTCDQTTLANEKEKVRRVGKGGRGEGGRSGQTFGNCDPRETLGATRFLVELGQSSLLYPMRAAEKRANDF